MELFMSVKPLKTATDKIKSIEEWRAVIVRYESSGLAQKQFCVREGIRFGTFKTWLYRLKAIAKKDCWESTKLFTPIIVAQEVAIPVCQEPGESSLILELCGDMHIVVAAGFGAETLRRLIHVVRGIHV
jgi:hypothetical protein